MSRRRMSHRKKKHAALIALAVVAAVAVLIAAGILIWKVLSYQEPVPIGTPNQTPVVDQKPVSSSETSASSSAGAQPGSSSSPDESRSESASSAASSSAGVPVASSSSDASGEQCLRGTITDTSTSQITVVDESGRTLSFWRETAEVTGRLVEEATVDIYYIGSLNGTDTSACYVTRIVSYS